MLALWSGLAGCVAAVRSGLLTEGRLFGHVGTRDQTRERRDLCGSKKEHNVAAEVTFDLII